MVVVVVGSAVDNDIPDSLEYFVTTVITYPEIPLASLTRQKCRYGQNHAKINLDINTKFTTCGFWCEVDMNLDSCVISMAYLFVEDSNTFKMAKDTSLLVTPEILCQTNWFGIVHFVCGGNKCDNLAYLCDF